MFQVIDVGMYMTYLVDSQKTILAEVKEYQRNQRRVRDKGKGLPEIAAGKKMSRQQVLFILPY